MATLDLWGPLKFYVYSSKYLLKDKLSLSLETDTSTWRPIILDARTLMGFYKQVWLYLIYMWDNTSHLTWHHPTLFPLLLTTTFDPFFLFSTSFPGLFVCHGLVCYRCISRELMYGQQRATKEATALPPSRTSGPAHVGAGTLLSSSFFIFPFFNNSGYQKSSKFHKKFLILIELSW